jgi:putative polyhydroxyalkanoic acid system protein
MSAPIQVDLPHNLGAAEAKRRIERNFGRLTEHLPGQAQVSERWEGDRLALEIAALGQELAASIDVEERRVRVSVILPPALAFFGKAIEAGLRSSGPALLEKG